MKQAFTTLLYANIVIIIFFLPLACSAPGHKFFEKRTPHEAYQNKIENAALQNTALGIAWLKAAQQALQQPVNIGLPFKETAWFAAESPGAYGYLFFVRRGEQVNISISANDTTSSWALFADLWRKQANAAAELLAAADTLNKNIRYEATRDDSCILRIQPELLKSGGYTVTITTLPSLAFPVPSDNNPRIGSFWGDARDAGARSHEGIDIFGKLRTPVVAAADGYITRVGINNLGGKIIFMRPEGKDYSLYYAHLDSQIAKEGQNVKSGEIIGLMGNTGNAKYTPTHLHFGIYATGGAIDPLPFVKSRPGQIKPITTSANALNKYVRNTNSTNIFASPSNQKNIIEKVNAGTALYVAGATDNLYKIQLPNGQQCYVAANVVNVIQKPLRTLTIDTATILLAEAQRLSAGKKLLDKGSSIDVYGMYNDFYLVESDGMRGWIKK